MRRAVPEGRRPALVGRPAHHGLRLALPRRADTGAACSGSAPGRVARLDAPLHHAAVRRPRRLHRLPDGAAVDGRPDGYLARSPGSPAAAGPSSASHRQNMIMRGMGNKVAAMPSLHTGIAALVAFWAISRLRSPWRWLLLLYPVAMALALCLLRRALRHRRDRGVLVAGAVMLGWSLYDRRAARRSEPHPNLAPEGPQQRHGPPERGSAHGVEPDRRGRLGSEDLPTPTTGTKALRDRTSPGGCLLRQATRGRRRRPPLLPSSLCESNVTGKRSTGGLTTCRRRRDR